MAANVIYNVIVDFSTGFKLGSADVTDANVTALSLDNVVNDIPKTWIAGMGIELRFHLWDNLEEDVTTDCSSMTASLYGRLLSSAVAKTTLDTGTVSGANNNIITYVVDKDTIPEGWSRGSVVRINPSIVNGAGVQKIEFYQDIKVVSIDQFDESTPTTEDFDIDVTAIANATTKLAVQPGLRYIVLDGALGAATCELPTTPGFDGATFIIQCIDSTNTCTVDGDGATINGDATFTMLADESAVLFEYNSNYILVNPSIGVS